MKGEEGVWGASAPPEASRMKRSQIKWKLLLFNESDFFFIYFSILFNMFNNRAMLFVLLQIKKCVFVLKPNQIIK